MRDGAAAAVARCSIVGFANVLFITSLAHSHCECLIVISIYWERAATHTHTQTKKNSIKSVNKCTLAHKHHPLLPPLSAAALNIYAMHVRRRTSQCIFFKDSLNGSIGNCCIYLCTIIPNEWWRHIEVSSRELLLLSRPHNKLCDRKICGTTSIYIHI